MRCRLKSVESPARKSLPSPIGNPARVKAARAVEAAGESQPGAGFFSSRSEMSGCSGVEFSARLVERHQGEITLRGMVPACHPLPGVTVIQSV